MPFFRRSKKGSNSKVSDEPSVPPPPELPANEKAPWINIPSSSFSNDWEKLINKSRLSDVTFELGATSYSAHRYVLCSASDVFRMLFNVSLPSGYKVQTLPQCSSGWSKRRLAKVASERAGGKEMEGILAMEDK